MATKGPLSSRPPIPRRPDSDALAAFIEGASVQTDSPVASPVTATAPEPYPWEAPGVRADVAKLFNVRLPEPYLLKLKYIAEHVPESMQQFCLNSLLPAIDQKIEDLTQSLDHPPRKP